MSNYVDEIVGGDGIRRYDVYGEDGALIHPRVELRKNYVAAQEGSPWGAAEANVKLDTSAYTAQDVLNKIKTVDGAGSGLDADLLDGRNAANAANGIPILDATGKLPVAQIPTGATASTVSLGNHGHNNYAASSHSHNYLPLTGGTVTGATNFTGRLTKDGYDVITSQTNVTMEIGTWTPYGQPGVSFEIYGTPRYKRVGDIVWVSCELLNFSVSGKRDFAISGLPYTTGGYKGLCSMGWANVIAIQELSLSGNLCIENANIHFWGTKAVNLSGTSITLSGVYALN